MAQYYEAWMIAYGRLQLQLGAGELASAWSAHADLRDALPGVANEGLDLAETCRIMCVLAEADLLMRERRFFEADERLAQAEPRLPIPHKHDYISANRLMAQANLCLLQDSIEQALALFEQVLAATPSDNLGLRANALYNLGVCCAITDDGVRSRQAFVEAAKLYEAIGAIDRHADCLHMIGNLLRAEKAHLQALSLYIGALEIYKKIGNLRGAWMAFDDASRALFLHAVELEGTNEFEVWARQALEYSTMATFASDRVWRAANDRQRHQLSIDFENHLANRVEIALALAPDLVHAALAHQKGRIRASLETSTAHLLALVRNRNAREAIKRGVSPALVTAVVPAVRKLRGENRRVAVLDQIRIKGRTLVTAVHIVGPRLAKTEVVISSLLSKQAGEDGDAEEPVFRATSRRAPADAIAERLMKEIRIGGRRVMTLMGEAAQLEGSDEREQVAAWASELDADATVLGEWFFSAELVALLRKHEVDHVVLVPDPRYLVHRSRDAIKHSPV